MPHASVNIEPVPVRKSRKTTTKAAPRELLQLRERLHNYLTLYNESQLSQSINSALKSFKTPITKVLSLGLGSLGTQGKESQSRRLKQLAIFLAIADTIRQNSNGVEPVLYAQDPAFSRTDEALLSALGINILRTPSLSDLGAAGALIDDSTLVYSPFLTVDAYELLLNGPNVVRHLIGDDFEALKLKWPKHSPEKQQVDSLVKQVVSRYRRRAIKGSGFWDEGDKTFPIAVYRIEEERKDRKEKL